MCSSCLFHDFLMHFFCFFKLTKEVKIRDITGKKEMLAINIFKHTIKYFRKLMLNTINGQYLDVKETNIRWVLAVPAIWSDKAKQLISEAAELVSISPYLPITHRNLAYCNTIVFSRKCVLKS